MWYRKIPKISPLFEGLIFGGAFIRRGLSTEGNLRFKIDWVSLIVGSKFTVFALFYFTFVGKFPITSPRGAYIWRGDLTECFLRYWIGELTFRGAYTWRGLFSEFYGNWINSDTLILLHVTFFRFVFPLYLKRGISVTAETIAVFGGVSQVSSNRINLINIQKACFYK